LEEQQYQPESKEGCMKRSIISTLRYSAEIWPLPLTKGWMLLIADGKETY